VFGRGGYVGGGVHGRALQETLLAALRAPAGTPIPIELPPAERVYVKDAGFALREAVFVEKPTTRVYNVGSGEIVTAAMVAAAINEAVPGAQVVGAAEGADAVRPLDITLARTELQYQPRWPLREAIADYVSELRQHGA
jgi:nucleoside-diphosphate-sugar epimerase